MIFLKVIILIKYIKSNTLIYYYLYIIKQIFIKLFIQTQWYLLLFYMIFKYDLKKVFKDT